MKLAINSHASRTPFQTESIRSGRRLRRSTERPLSKPGLAPGPALISRKPGAKSFDNPPLRDTIRLAQQGDAAAFEAIYQRHAGRVYAICLRMLRDSAEAEDTLQEAFLQLFRKIQTFRGESAFSTWLHRLTVNMVFMRLRRKKPICVPLDEVLESDDQNSKPLHEIGGPDLHLAGLLDRMPLQAAVDQLPEGYKRMFILHDVQGYRHSEIAEILGHSIGNSKSQLHKARKRLRELLKRAPHSKRSRLTK